MSTRSNTPEQVCKYDGGSCKHVQCYDVVKETTKATKTIKSFKLNPPKKKRFVLKLANKKRVWDLPKPPIWALDHKPGSKPYQRDIAKRSTKLLEAFENCDIDDEDNEDKGDDSEPSSSSSRTLSVTD